MAIDQPPELNLEDPDWQFPILEWLVEDSKGSCPPTRRRLDASRGEQRHSSSSRASSTTEGLLAYSCGASLEIRAARCYDRSTPAPAVIMQAREHLSGKLSEKDSTNPRRWRTPRTLYGVARGASSMLDKPISRRKRSRPSPSRGLSPCGTSTWWGPSDKRPGASRISSWQ
jgi:hypothetical protein